MKRLISAALALSLLGATAASAAPATGYAPVDYRDHYRHHDNGNGAAVAAGIGFLALAAIMASQNHDRDEWRDRDWRDRDRDEWRDRYYGNRGYGYGYAQPYGGYRGW